VACQADEILLQENGQIMLMGLGGEELYLAGMLEKIGAQADFVQVGKYKGAEEPLTRRGPSEEWNENIDMLLDDLYAQALERIGRRRGLSRDEVEAAMRESWTLSDQELVERKLVDRTVPRDLRAATAPSLGQGFFWDDEMGRESGNALKANNPLALFQMLFNPQSARSTKPQLAIVYAIGPIASGESQLEGAFTSETIGSRTIARAMLRAAQRDQVKGVLLRLDSPGGSALASEVIWQAVHTCAQRKPVYISLGGIAASGGYYIASAGTRVYASPSTILGSIGVVGGKITFGGTYEKLGVSVYRRHRGPIAGMFNSVEPFTKEQRKLIRKSMQNTYDLFLQRIREGRGKQIGNVSDIAQGRVFTGRQAVNNGMIDKTDNLETALADLAKAANLEEGEYDLIRLPERITFPEFLQQALTNAQGPPNLPAQVKVSSLPLLQAAKKVMGEQRWRAVSRTMTGLLLMQEEPVLTLMPSALVVD
jgi:protease-4